MPPMPSGYVAPALLERKTPNYNYTQLPSGVIVATNHNPVIEADVPSFSPPGTYGLVGLGSTLQFDDSATGSAVPLPIPSRSSGDLLIAIGFTAQMPGASNPLFEPFDPEGQKWDTVLMFATSYIEDPGFGDTCISIYARLATGDADDETIYLRNAGQSTFGQVASFSGAPATLTNIAVSNGEQEYGPGLGTANLESMEMVGTGFTDTLGICASIRRTNVNPTVLDDDIVVSAAPAGFTLASYFNIPSFWSGDNGTIGAWGWASCSLGEDRGGNPWTVSDGFSTIERTLQCYTRLKSSTS